MTETQTDVGCFPVTSTEPLLSARRCILPIHNTQMTQKFQECVNARGDMNGDTPLYSFCEGEKHVKGWKKLGFAISGKSVSGQKGRKTLETYLRELLLLVN